MLDEFLFKPFRNKSLILLFIISTILSSYVLFWVYLRLEPGIPFYILYPIFFISSFSGFSLALSELRFIIISLIFIILLFIIYYLAYSTLYLLSSFDNNLFYLNYYFKKYFATLSFLSAISWLTNWFLFRWRYFLYIQVIAYLFIIISLFKVHRNYHLSRLDLFSFVNLPHISDLMLFFIFIFLLFLMITLYFYFDEQRKHNVIESNTGKNIKKSILNTITFVFIFIFIAVILHYYVQNEEPRLSGGLKLKFNEKEYLDLYPNVSMNPRERKVIVKLEPQHKVNYAGKVIPIDYQYITWKILSGYHPKKNLFYINRPHFEKTSPLDSKNFHFTLKDPGYKNRISHHQEYYIIDFPENESLAQNFPIEIQRIKNKNPEVFSSAFRVESKVFNGPIKELDRININSMNKTFYNYYTKAPILAKYKKLAKKLTQGVESRRKKMEALVRYFHSNFSYSLSPGGENRKDRLSYFLFQNKKGYCTYFAFSMTALARSLNIPARVVVGFITDSDNKVENYYLLHSSNMHAWTEIYFEQYGWIIFDPTPSMSIANQMKPDRQYLTNLIHSLESETMDQPLQKKAMSSSIKEKSKPGELDNLFYLALIVSLIFFIPFGKLIYYMRIKYTHNPLRKIFYSYQFVHRTLKDYGLRKRIDETDFNFARRVYNERGIHLLPLARTYLKVKYSNSYTETFEVTENFSLFMKSLDKFPLWKRIFSYFNLSFYI